MTVLRKCSLPMLLGSKALCQDLLKALSLGMWFHPSRDLHVPELNKSSQELRGCLPFSKGLLRNPGFQQAESEAKKMLSALTGSPPPPSPSSLLMGSMLHPEGIQDPKAIRVGVTRANSVGCVWIHFRTRVYLSLVELFTGLQVLVLKNRKSPFQQNYSLRIEQAPHRELEG